MFVHTTSQYQMMSLAYISQATKRTVTKTHLSIAVGAVLSCFTMQVHAVDNNQINDTVAIDVQEANFEQLETPNVDNRKLSNDAFVAQQAQLFFECTQVRTAAARLACFDKVAEQGETPSYTTTKQPLDLAGTIKSTISGDPQVVLAEDMTKMQGDTVEAADTVLIANQLSSNNGLNKAAIDKTQTEILNDVGVTQSDIEKYTPLSLAYDLDQNSEQGTWSARPHRPMYLLPLFLNAKPNRNPSTPTRDEEVISPNELRVPELKLQVSIKTKVAEDLFDTNADMWFGYTQQSHWQVYNEDNSRPFRATDYEPEVFITQPVTANLPFGGRLRMLGAGASHHSNGQSDNLSRSWNRAYLMAGAEWGKFAIVPRLWTRVSTESGDTDDNPDIEDFLGYGDMKFLYDLPNKHSVSGTLRYNPKTEKGAAQVDYIYPLSNNVNGYVQLFHGYGESIIDYNHKNTAVGVGIVLNDWKGL